MLRNKIIFIFNLLMKTKAIISCILIVKKNLFLLILYK